MKTEELRQISLRLAEALVDSINNLTAKDRQLCALLELSNLEDSRR